MTNLRPVVSRLLIAAIVLPIVICVVIGVSALLGAMDDAVGGAVLGRIALAAGILWVVDLIGLLLVQALAWLADDERPEP